MKGVRRRLGEYFFVKTRAGSEGGSLTKFRPEDALRAHDTAWNALLREVGGDDRKPTVVITHHAPSRLGANPQVAGNGLDGAYVSDLDQAIRTFENVPVWIHGHTHVARSYRIGSTIVRTNALGFAAKGQGAPGFSATARFEV
jgi:Icc-related predicted phosphoesterase